VSETPQEKMYLDLGRPTPQEVLEKWLALNPHPEPTLLFIREAIRAILTNQARAAKAYDSLDLKLNQAEAECATLRQDAANVLARIHRDGGHHTAEVGWKQSCLDAEQEWIALRAEVERLRAGWEKAAEVGRQNIRSAFECQNALTARAEKAEAALRPFAALDISGDEGTEAWDAMIRQARAALRDTAPAEQPEAGEGKP